MTRPDPKTADLEARDARVLWHPATHFRDLESLAPIVVRGAEGCELLTPEGRRILDGISSWWTCLHGHGHPAIVEAIARQAAQLDHVMFAGFTHEPAIALAEALLEHAPRESDGAPYYGKVFYSDCGSASIEVAMKLSFQSRVQRGETERRRFATLSNSYHGETLGALAACGADDYRALFSPLLVDVLHLDAPDHDAHRHEDLEARVGGDSPEADAACAALEAHADELTALLIEPIVQCAGRMVMPGSGFYRRVCETAQRLGIHVIADEIAVGFGRTGRLFASEWAGVTPDLLCISKGLSGGVLPLAATLIRRGFEDDFKGSPSRSFMHSHTFTGNPIACASGLASLRLLLDERLAELPRRIEMMTQGLRSVAEACPSIAEWRQSGLIGALRVEASERAMPAGGRLGLALRRAALARDVLLRPLHDTIYWMPPLIAGRSEYDRLTEVTIEVVREVVESA